MTSKDNDLPENIAHPDLLKSLQELSLTLNLLKTLATDLKYKLENTPSKAEPQNTSGQNHIIEPHSTLQ